MSDTPYIVSARKYRPATFQSVVGQHNLTATLKNAIDTGRLAQAYLFCGPRGVGKTSCARIFAKTINCLHPTPEGEACGECESCRAIDAGNSFNIIELDAASNNSVGDIRNITEQVNIPPSSGKYRVFIIDEVHMLTSAAFNAFLKTLEEPPKYVIFILATTEKHKVIPTILSRCQIFDFKRITIRDMVDHLSKVAEAEGITADSPSLNVIARKADGAMRDALSIFDQVAATCAGHITYEKTLEALNVLDYEYYFRLVDAFAAGDVPAALMIYQDIRNHGFDTLFFINGLSSHVRDLMVAFSPQTTSLLEVADDIAQRYTQQARKLPVDWLYAAMKILNDCDYQYRTASNKQFLAELTLIRLCQLLNPPTPPFDRVDSDITPLGDIAAPQNISASASSHTASSSAHTPQQLPAAEAPHLKAVTPASSSQVAEPSRPETPSAPAHNTIQTAPRAPETPAANNKHVGFRLSQIEENVSKESYTEKKRDKVCFKDFKKIWDEYTAQHSAQHILISAMRKARLSPEPLPDNPESGDDVIFENCRVLVDHPAEKQAFESAMQELIRFLRERLSNDYLYLTIEIDTATEQPRQLPPAEFLKVTLEANKALASFISESDMEII